MKTPKYLLVAALFFSLISAYASSSVDSAVSGEAPAYASMDEAAVAALRDSVSRSTHLEYGGCIFENQNRFYFTEPVSSGSSDSFKASCLASGSWKMVALFHTHPQGFMKGVSNPDIGVAQNMGKVSYVAVLENNTVIKYVPGHTKTECPASGGCGSGQRISRGDLVEPNL
jgi:hypothetical protein